MGFLKKVTVFLISILTVVSYGASGNISGDGSFDSPFLIEDFQDFKTFINPLNQDTYWVQGTHTILTSDIDLSPLLDGRETYTDSLIASDTDRATGYMGFFHAKGHTIVNLNIIEPSASTIGLFGNLGEYGEVQDLKLVDVNISGSTDIAAIVGYNLGKVKRCSVSGQLLGYIATGSIVGHNHGDVINSSSTASVISTSYAGGLVGLNFYGSVIENSSFSGTVSGYDSAGGLVGMNLGHVSNCYSAGLVQRYNIDYPGNAKIGGFVGENDGVIHNSYSYAQVLGVGDVGGFTGVSYGESVNCFWDVDVSGISTSAEAVGLSTSEMKDVNSFIVADWDYVNEYTDGVMDIWTQRLNEYPTLYWQWDLACDFNYDDAIDIVDLTILANYWLLGNDDLPHDLLSGKQFQRLIPDCNYDGIVDFDDYTILAHGWMF